MKRAQEAPEEPCRFPGQPAASHDGDQAPFGTEAEANILPVPFDSCNEPEDLCFTSRIMFPVKAVSCYEPTAIRPADDAMNGKFSRFRRNMGHDITQAGSAGRGMNGDDVAVPHGWGHAGAPCPEAEGLSPVQDRPKKPDQRRAGEGKIAGGSDNGRGFSYLKLRQ